MGSGRGSDLVLLIPSRLRISVFYVKLSLIFSVKNFPFWIQQELGGFNMTQFNIQYSRGSSPYIFPLLDL